MRSTLAFVLLLALLTSTRTAVAELVRFDISGTLQIKSGLEPIPANSHSIGCTVHRQLHF